MNLLVKVGYDYILFPKDCDFNALLASFGKAFLVKEAGTWDNRVYEIISPKEAPKIELSIVPDGVLIVNNISEEPMIEKLLSLQTKIGEKDSEIFKLKNQLSKLQETLNPKTT